MCSLFLASYLALYFAESSVVPLLRSHVTVGAGSPLTIVLKSAFFPIKAKYGVPYNSTAVGIVVISFFFLVKYGIYPPEQL